MFFTGSFVNLVIVAWLGGINEKSICRYEC